MYSCAGPKGQSEISLGRAGQSYLRDGTTELTSLITSRDKARSKQRREDTAKRDGNRIEDAENREMKGPRKEWWDIYHIIRAETKELLQVSRKYQKGHFLQMSKKSLICDCSRSRRGRAGKWRGGLTRKKAERQNAKRVRAESRLRIDVRINVTKRETRSNPKSGNQAWSPVTATARVTNTQPADPGVDANEIIQPTFVNGTVVNVRSTFSRARARARDSHDDEEISLNDLVLSRGYAATLRFALSARGAEYFGFTVEPKANFEEEWGHELEIIRDRRVNFHGICRDRGKIKEQPFFFLIQFFKSVVV